ncbi:hypothetical protein HY311_04065 [Candidatus Nomurabacteria bacterium]|nr:hypothetical protein [Candidatus Nomurabacteria bacterium]
MPNLIADSEPLQIISFITNIVFITWTVTSFFQGRRHKRELSNLFNSEYKTTQALADSAKDSNVKIQIQHLAEFLKAATRNLTGRRYDEVGGDHHNFFMRFLESFFERQSQKFIN